MKTRGPTIFTLVATAALAFLGAVQESNALIYTSVGVGVLALINVVAYLHGNWEREGYIGKLYGRIKISDTPFYVWSRDRLKRTQWFELGHVENTSGTKRAYTITIFHLTAQIAWTGEREQKEETVSEEFIYRKPGSEYKGPYKDAPPEAKQSWEAVRKLQDEIHKSLNDISKGKK